jgi:hypothetical protein
MEFYGVCKKMHWDKEQFGVEVDLNFMAVYNM